jgi:DNA/RNA-binding domain of Phe-tRNA-synthetase-like protein
MELKQIQISDSLGDIARIGVVFFKQVSNGAVSSVLRKRMEAMGVELRNSIGDRQISELDPIRETRKLYHLLGVDPTKDRPSSERLLRRVMQNRGLPKLSKLVDAVNLVSLSLQCPLGVYDWDKVVPPVLVRIGRPEESYLTAANEPMSLEGRLVLVDGEGLFGNPSHDSSRTSVTLGTVRAMVVAWTSVETPKARLEAVLQEVIVLAREFCDARVAESGVLG